MVSLLESVALELWESCSGQLPELSDKEAKKQHCLDVNGS